MSEFSYSQFLVSASDPKISYRSDINQNLADYSSIVQEADLLFQLLMYLTFLWIKIEANYIENESKMKCLLKS